MRSNYPQFLLLALIITACAKQAGGSGGASSVASLSVGPFKPAATLPQWQSGELILTLKPASSGGNIDRKFDASGLSAASVQVPYGVYNINLIYSDASGKVVYQACADDAQKDRDIKVPVYQTSLSICPVGSTTPAATVAVTPPSGNSTQQTPANGTGSAVTPATFSGNPFAGATMFVDPSFVTNVKASIALYPDLSAQMAKVQNFSTALWLDTTAKIGKLQPLLEAARSAQAGQSQPMVVSVVVYNLPDRDCAAASSNGELSIAGDGLTMYKAYVDQIATIFNAYQDLRIVAMIEPDSLGNMATNMNITKCANAQTTYMQGVAYAISKLAASHVGLYLDAGHGGWLGWANNRQAYAGIVRQVLSQAGAVTLIRGFATNVSNYSPLNATAPQNWYDASNPSIDELTYTNLLGQDLANAGITNHSFVIDTSRNGVVASRQIWGNWCNIKLAGIGQRPAVAPSSGVDAYLWIKTPGESDGTNDASAPRFDKNCRSPDAITLVATPQAGDWFAEHFATLVRNASPSF